jgi:NAD(P)-dependent dehydrogenase (short-subunit alcohol dehydrogenase family)
MSLEGKTILITGAARRIGRHLALTAARAGADVIIHHSGSADLAREVQEEIVGLGRRAWVLQADFNDPGQAEALVERAWACSKLYAVVHNAAIFEPLSLLQTGLADWQRHLDINLTAPFLISREFARKVEVEPAAAEPGAAAGRMVTLLDWRALRPGADHFAYTISKAALAAMTKALAAALAPRITVNGLALGAILPPSGGSPPANILQTIPAGRWAELEEVSQALLFLLDGPAFITGEILHVDGGRHLV